MILEAFKAGTVPIAVSAVLDGSEKLTAEGDDSVRIPVVALEGFGGLY